MRLVDTNVLLYAVDSSARHHAESRGWLDRSLVGTETVAFTWLTVVGFVRIATSPRIFEDPLSLDDATEQARRWLGAPAARVVEPGSDHLRTIARLLEPTGTAGNLVSDAHLAAVALANRAVVVTFDNDVDRFSDVRWERPG